MNFPSWDGGTGGSCGDHIANTWMPRRFLYLSQIIGIGNLGRKGQSQNVQVQTQGYLIRREDYIAVTRVGLGGRLDRNRQRPASLHALKLALRRSGMARRSSATGRATERQGDRATGRQGDGATGRCWTVDAQSFAR